MAFTNVEATLKQRQDEVVSTLFERRTNTLYQRSVTLKIRRHILFHFQRWINVILTLIHSVETALIGHWNVCWAKKNSNKPINFVHLQWLANQSMSQCALVNEKSFTVFLMKARKSMVVRWREKRTNWEKITWLWKYVILKLFVIDFG